MLSLRSGLVARPILVIFFLVCVTGAIAQHSSGNDSENGTETHHASVRVARFDFDRVATPFTFAFAIFVAGIVKLSMAPLMMSLSASGI